MNELLQFASSVDWSSVLIGAGTVATALGFGLGTPLIVAGKTLKEVRKTIEATPISNQALQVVAENLELKHAQKELSKLQVDSTEESGGEF